MPIKKNNNPFAFKAKQGAKKKAVANALESPSRKRLTIS